MKIRQSNSKGIPSYTTFSPKGGENTFNHFSWVGVSLKISWPRLCVHGTQSHMPRVNTLSDSKLLHHDSPQASVFRAQQPKSKMQLLSSERPSQEKAE